MGKVAFSEKEISVGINKLINRLSTISINIEIVDRYFTGFVVSNKTLGLSIILGEVARNICGQLSRICFDTANKSYKTASLLEIYSQIAVISGTVVIKGIRHQAKFDNVKEELASLKIKYDAVNQYSDKNCSHIEIEPINEESEKLDYTILKMGWPEVKELNKKAKEILNIILLYWEDNENDFAEDQYEEIKKGFWKIIDIPQEPIDLKLPPDDKWFR